MFSPARMRALFAGAALALAAFATPAALAQGSAAESPADQAFDAAVIDDRAGRLPAARAGFERSCNLGSAVGCFALGFMMRDGTGGAKDEVGARAAYTKACDGNVAGGCTMIGVMMFTGRGGPADSGQAKAMFEKGCKLGHQSACEAAAKP